MNNGEKDRRQYPRFPSEIEMEGLPEGGGVFAQMRTENLSLGGVYCSSSADFPEMTKLAVRLRLPVGERRLSVATVDAEWDLGTLQEAKHFQRNRVRFNFHIIWYNWIAETFWEFENKRIVHLCNFRGWWGYETTYLFG